MKKLLFAVCAVLVPASLLALPLGNPSDPSLYCNGIFFCPSSGYDNGSLWSVRLGYYGDFVPDRHLQLKASSHSHIHKTDIRTNAAYVALNICNRFDIFTTLGASKIFIQTPNDSFVNSNIGDNAPFQFDTETTFSWSIGARAALWQYRCLTVGAEGQYFRTEPHANSLHLPSFNRFYYPSGDYAKYQEWQLGLGASYRINIASCYTAIIPYAGIKWSRCSLDLPNRNAAVGSVSFIRLADLENARNFGYAIGFTLLGNSKASISVEWRYVDETAFHLNGQFRF